MANPLASPANLIDYPGAPFTDAVVDAAVAAVRREAGWHIAPEVIETLVVDSSGDRFLALDTLNLADVTEIRDVTYDHSTPVVTGWRNLKTPRYRAGVLERPGGWPRGVLEVDVVHGFTETPADLFPIIAAVANAQRTGRGGGAMRIGSLSVSMADPGQTVADGLAPYRVRGLP